MDELSKKHNFDPHDITNNRDRKKNAKGKE